jgi:hypothetical protein
MGLYLARGLGLVDWWPTAPSGPPLPQRPSPTKETAWGRPALPTERGTAMPWSSRAGQAWRRGRWWRVGAHPTMRSFRRQPASSGGSAGQGEEATELT